MEQNIRKIDCPNCGGRMLYDIARRRVVCQFCGCIRRDDGSIAIGADHTVTGIVKGTALYDYDGVKAADMSAASSAATSAAASAGTASSYAMRTAVCSSCGAELMFEDGSIQTSCPFCGSVHIDMTGIDDNTPAGIIPFKVDQAGVETALRFPIGNNVLVPKPFKALVTYDKYKAVYLPLWAVSAEVNVDFTAKYGDRPKNLKNSMTAQFSRSYSNVPTSASKKYAETLTEQLEEFNLAGNEHFSPELLAGIPAERCSFSLEEAWPIIEASIHKRIREDILEQIMKKTGSAECEVVDMKVSYVSKDYKYILVPLWINTVEFKGHTFCTSINGETAIYGGGYPTITGKIGHPTYFK